MVGRRTEKLTERFVGPFKVKAIISTNAIKLECNDKASCDDCLITLNVMRERRELDGVSWWIVLPTYTLFLFVYVYA